MWGKASMNGQCDLREGGHSSAGNRDLATNSPLITRAIDIAAACPIPEVEVGLLHVGGVLNEHDRAVGNSDARYNNLFRVILRVNRNIAPAIRPATARPGDAP
jgi:hypothetical protein